eukprot:TRINITY_DN3114_c0_g1_i1.p1 TRINITY_DN3114_c0_g1~~TRINITY_DN3114_c0_g1_i1.p1  ORF type:complete len:207 (+),score=40.31 TRINITY_DN3114_c0_g1_i1:975-1595(+)
MLGPQVRALKEALRHSDEYLHTILVSHYCTNFIMDSQWRSFMQDIDTDPLPFTMFLCGHLHMRSTRLRKQQGYIEMELDSFATAGSFRVVAFDHSIFGVRDSTLQAGWPLVVIVSPKSNAIIADTEPISQMRHSSDIRALVFSPTPVRVVTASIDGKHVCSLHPSAVVPHLFSCPWDASEYATGDHGTPVFSTRDINNEYLSGATW